MSHDSLHAFFLAAPLIYIATTQLAATHASEAEIETLKAIQEDFRKAIEEKHVENRVIHNDAFHLEIGRMAHNDYLMPSLRRLLIDHARLGKIFYRHPTTDDMQRDLELACDQHDQIVDAIQRRDPDAAADRPCAFRAVAPAHGRVRGAGRSGGGAGLRGLASPAPWPRPKRRRSRRDGYRVPITRVRSLR